MTARRRGRARLTYWLNPPFNALLIVRLDLRATVVLQVTSLRSPAVTPDVDVTSFYLPSNHWCFNPLLLNTFVLLSFAIMTDLKELSLVLYTFFLTKCFFKKKSKMKP